MYLPLIAMSVIAAVFGAVLSWAMARRYGRRRALLVPVLAVAAAVFSVSQSDILDGSDAITRVALAMVFAGPAVAGGLVGLALAGRNSG